MGRTPAIADPASGVILASAFGTSYIVRVPLGAMEEATRLGYRSDHRFTGGEVVDLAVLMEAGWVFGRWLDFESNWLRSVVVTLGPP